MLLLSPVGRSLGVPAGVTPAMPKSRDAEHATPPTHTHLPPLGALHVDLTGDTTGHEEESRAQEHL